MGSYGLRVARNHCNMVVEIVAKILTVFLLFSVRAFINRIPVADADIERIKNCQLRVENKVQIFKFCGFVIFGTK